jgi:hypothetical protein
MTWKYYEYRKEIERDSYACVRNTAPTVLRVAPMKAMLEGGLRCERTAGFVRAARDSQTGMESVD